MATNRASSGVVSSNDNSVTPMVGVNKTKFHKNDVDTLGSKIPCASINNFKKTKKFEKQTIVPVNERKIRHVSFNFGNDENYSVTDDPFLNQGNEDNSAMHTHVTTKFDSACSKNMSGVSERLVQTKSPGHIKIKGFNDFSSAVTSIGLQPPGVPSYMNGTSSAFIAIAPMATTAELYLV